MTKGRLSDEALEKWIPYFDDKDDEVADALRELQHARRLIAFWNNWRPVPREPVERFLHDDERGWVGPAIFMNGEALVRESAYGAAMATVELLNMEIERLRSSATAAEKQRDEALSHEGAKDLRITELDQKARSFEAALRGDMGIQFEDGYVVNVAALKHALDEACRSCGCSVVERDSGHRVGCQVPEWREVLEEKPI